jgi:Mg-chelatase subunit ChlD
MELSSTFSYSKVDYSKSNKVHLLVSARAPKVELSEDRAPIHLVLALDVSGSMGGQKIEYVKRSASKCVEHLSDKDKLGIVLFDYNARVLFNPMSMTAANKTSALSAISGIRANGSTHMSGALSLGTEMGNALEKYRLVFLTDGQPTCGEINKEAIRSLAKRCCLETGSITSFGYGTDHDPEFLSVLASENRGNYAYIKNPDDALKAFALELGGLLSCYGQQLEFKITPKDGIKIEKVVSDVDVVEEGEGIKVSVPDIYSEAAQHIVLEVTLPKQDSALPRAITLFDVELSYTDTKTGDKKSIASKAKINFVKEKDADEKPVKEVMAEVQLAQLMEAQAAAEAAAERGDYARAATLINNVQYDHLSFDGIKYRDTLTRNVASYESYENAKYAMKGTRMSHKNTARGASAGSVNITGASASNSVQDAFVQSFTAPLDNVVVSSSSVVVPDTGSVPVAALEDENKLSKKRVGRW